ncbi:MAG: G-D-S-L family lipolytic protein [Saprospiraceae bacterium]|nr:G-D-S-L family lipolytic protein [Saprospiraceae bacterium]
MSKRVLTIFISSVLSCLYIQAQDPLRFQSQIRELEALPEATRGAHIIFTGSSSIRMWKTLAEDFTEHEVVNKGFGGSQMSDLGYYLEELVLSNEPCQIFIYEGDNDLNAGKTTDQILTDTREILARVQKSNPETQVVLISPKPSVARWHLKVKYEDLNKQLRLLADEDPHWAFADVWSPALDKNGEVLKDIFIDDNLHMNAKGYAIWKETIEPFLSSCAKR